MSRDSRLRQSSRTRDEAIANIQDAIRECPIGARRTRAAADGRTVQVEVVA